MEQKHLLRISELKHLLKIINIWNTKSPNLPLPAWIIKRCDKLTQK